MPGNLVSPSGQESAHFPKVETATMTTRYSTSLNITFPVSKGCTESKVEKTIKNHGKAGVMDEDYNPQESISKKHPYILSEKKFRIEMIRMFKKLKESMK